MPKISIVIPVYNTEKYLRQCLDSVVNQTLKDIEIICVNDGSTDNSLNILKEYMAQDNRIKVVNKKNGGLSSARNEGLKYITSEYCYFLDSDDYIESNLLETACNFLANNEIDYYCFGSEIFFNYKNMIQDTNAINEYLRIKYKGIQKAKFNVGQNQNIHVWNKVFKTSIIKENNVRFIDGLLYEDIFFTWYYFFLSQKIYFDPHIFHHYRIHPGSIMEKAIQNKSYKSAVPHMYNWHELFLEISQNKKLFIKNYRNLVILLKQYTIITIEMARLNEEKQIKNLSKVYQKELNTLFIKKCGIIRFLLCYYNVFLIKI